MLGGAHLKFWEDSFAISDRIDERVSDVERAVLVVLGGYDWNVPPQEASLWQKTFEKAPEGVDHDVKLLPAITHALNRITQPDWRKIQPSDIGAEVDAQVIEAVAAYFAGL